MAPSLRHIQLGVKGEILKLEIDPKSHSAWTGGKQKLMDKGRISKFNKKFKILNLVKVNDKCTTNAITTAVWLVENTTLTFKQIANFCHLHEVEVQGIADGEVAKGIKGYNPIISGQLSREEIELSSKDNERPLNIISSDMKYLLNKVNQRNTFLYLRDRINQIQLYGYCKIILC